MLQIYKKSAFIGLKGKEKVKKTAHYIFFYIIYLQVSQK